MLSDCLLDDLYNHHNLELLIHFLLSLIAIARAMEEWERRKEEGELGTEEEQEEENIYAVSKEQEVQTTRKNRPAVRTCAEYELLVGLKAIQKVDKKVDTKRVLKKMAFSSVCKISLLAEDEYHVNWHVLFPF